jgi:adenylate cyclase
MPNNPNRLSRFWQELKRRRVIHVITVYATAAFVIIELVNNLAEPLNLPASLPTIVIIILAIGFPLAIILSWLYDLTSEGVERTKPLSEIQEGEKPVVPNAWKIATYVSFVVIVGLVVFNIVTRGNIIKPGSIESMVILPFHNYTGDDQLEYAVSGMHSSLIGDMGKVSGMRILSETTSNLYKNAEKSVPQIASELGVDVVVEPTITCFGDSICLQVKVFSAFPEEKLLWVTDYREDRRNILNLYNRITKQIAEELKVELTDKEETLLADARTVNKDAYDNYLKGKFYSDRLGMEDLEKALDYFNHAIEMDSGWAPPYAGVAVVYGGLMQMGFMPPGEAMIEINKNLDKAIELDPDYPGSHYTKAVFGVWLEWDWEKGEREFLKALEINPNDVMSRIFYSHLLIILKRCDEAFFHSQMAVELDPMNPFVLALSAWVDLNRGEVQSALEKCAKALSIDPEHYFALSQFEYASYKNGDYKNSIETLLKIRSEPDKEARQTINDALQDKGYTAAIETMLGHLEEYASKNYICYFEMADYYLRVDNKEMGIESFKKAFEMHDSNMPYITQPFWGFDKLQDDPRIISIVEKMNLPLAASN